MKNTSSTALVPGWYVEFQTALLRQAPRPGEIDQVTAEGWNNNQKSLKKKLADCLVPPPAEIHITLNRIARKVKVNRNRTPQESLDATGRAQYTDRKVVNAMPKGEGEEVEVVFFKPDLSQHNDFISDDDLEKEFELRGLKPADPVSVAAVNEADPAFADEKPHGTHWKDAKGNWCCATFSRWSGERRVFVYRSISVWDVSWWFAGVRK